MALTGISHGKKHKPILAIVYGPDGVGKSTFASEAPAPIFLGPEDGSYSLDVARFEGITRFQDIRDKVRELRNEQHEFKTLALDSLDHMENMLWREICEEAKVDNIEEVGGGYGKGYTAALKRWDQFMKQELRPLRDDKGMNIIAIAHSQVKAFNDPSQINPYDRYMLKLNDKAAALWREFVDAVLFSNYETLVRKEKGASKAKALEGSNERFLYTQRQASFDAKNRLGLPPQIRMELGRSWSNFFHASDVGMGESVEAMLQEIQSTAETFDEEKKRLVSETLVKAGKDPRAIYKIMVRVREVAGA